MTTLKDPATDLVAALNGQTIEGVALATGTNLWPTHMRNVEITPSPAVFLYNAGGPAPQVLLGGHRQAIYAPSVQVLVRGPAGDDPSGEKLARGVLAFLEQLVPAGYLSVFAQASAPAPLGEDSSQHSVWSFYVEARYMLSLA